MNKVEAIDILSTETKESVFLAVFFGSLPFSDMKRSLGVFVCAACLSIIILPQLCCAKEEHQFLKKGKKEIGISSGFGWSFNSDENIDTIPVNIHWGYYISEVQRFFCFQGSLEALMEGGFNYLFRNRRHYGVGMAGLLRYNFGMSSSWVPFLQAGVGVWHSNVDVPDFPNEYNFSPQAGAGIQYFLNEYYSIRLEYRIQHFSNAGLRSNNGGLNFHNVLIGFSYYY